MHLIPRINRSGKQIETEEIANAVVTTHCIMKGKQRETEEITYVAVTTHCIMKEEKQQGQGSVVQGLLISTYKHVKEKTVPTAVVLEVLS